MENMKVTWRKPEQLIPYERNQKKHDDKQIRNVANSIKRFWLEAAHCGGR